MSGHRPLPDVTFIDHQLFWAGTRERQIRVQRCGQCGSVRFPPRAVCGACQSAAAEWVDAGTQGWLYSWTVTHRAMMVAFRDSVPYVVGVVELDGLPGIRLLGQVVNADPGSLRIGMPMRAVFMDASDEVTLVNWEPRI